MFTRGDRILIPNIADWGVGHVLEMKGNKVKVFFRNVGTKNLILDKVKLVQLEGDNAADSIFDDPLSPDYHPRPPFKLGTVKALIKNSLQEIADNPEVQQKIEDIMDYAHRAFNEVMGQQFEGYNPSIGYKKTSDPNMKAQFLDEAYLQKERYAALFDHLKNKKKKYLETLEKMESNIKNRDRLS